MIEITAGECQDVSRLISGISRVDTERELRTIRYHSPSDPVQPVVGSEAVNSEADEIATCTRAVRAEMPDEITTTQALVIPLFTQELHDRRLPICVADVRRFRAPCYR